MSSGFWSSETLKVRLPSVVLPYSESNVVNCSYELTLGSQVYVTGQASKTRRDLISTEQINIPPGQFAQLLTEQRVSVPTDCLALISMKSGLKLRGLINVSGFHVDPGFSGHLLFSVYNAGPNDIVLSQGSPAFLIWFASLDQPTTDVYSGKRMGLASISDDDVMKLHGDVFTPHALAQRVAAIEGEGLRDRVAALESISTDRDRRRNQREVVVTGVIATLAASLLTLLVTLGAQAARSNNKSTTQQPPNTVAQLTPPTTAPGTTTRQAKP
jgi:dCTP deaminase